MSLATIVSTVKSSVSTAASTVDLGKLEGVATQAFLTGGAAAVLPALAAQTSTYISDPTEAQIVTIALQLAHGLVGLL